MGIKKPRAKKPRVIRSTGIVDVLFTKVQRRVLTKCHEIRNLGEYEGDLNIGERLIADLITACRAVADKIDTLPSPESAA
ncbi:MAG: hypothetical protein ACYDC8_15690 [Gammaproteobacteria bacterium]